MNNEIKEILDAWKNKKYILAYTFNYDSAREQNDKLLDYITNLQEENERLKKLKERYQLEKEDYKSRNDKALEYTNSDEMLKLREEFEYCNDKDLFDEFAGHLDRILRGSDK